MNKKFSCPCCGFYTFSEKPPGTYMICPVCYWEDDQLQFEDPFFEGGANSVSLEQAKKNFKLFSAVSEEFKNQVRLPTQEEKTPTKN